MNLNALQLLGICMIIFAFGAQTFLPGSVVYYSTVAPSASFSPAGTTPNTPLYLPANQQYVCTALTVGIQQAEILNATVQISSWTGSAWSIVGTYTLTYVGTLVGALDYQYSFTVGASGSLYALSYLIQTIDIGSFSGIGYVATQASAGFFAINGIQATSATTIRVTNPTLSFTYTVNATSVDYTNFVVFIKVFNGSTQLTQVNLAMPTLGNNFTGSYTLPAPGTYILNGFVTYHGTTTQQMSIITPFGTLDSLGSSLSFSDFYLAVGLFGVFFVFLGARKKKKES
jgi:hypothetical protein